MQIITPLVSVDQQSSSSINGASHGASTSGVGASVMVIDTTTLSSRDSQQQAVITLRNEYMNKFPRDIADQGPYEHCATGWGERVIKVQEDVTEMARVVVGRQRLSVIPKERCFIAWHMLLIACRTKDQSTAEAIIRANCPRISSCSIYSSALCVAVKAHNVEAVQRLATYEPEREFYFHALDSASENVRVSSPSADDINIFKCLVEHGPLTEQLLHKLITFITKSLTITASCRAQLLEVALKKIVEILRKNDLTIDVWNVCMEFQSAGKNRYFDGERWGSSAEDTRFFNRLMIHLCLLQTEFGRELDQRLIDMLCSQFRGEFWGTSHGSYSLTTGNLSDLVFNMAKSLLTRPFHRMFESVTLAQLDKRMSFWYSGGGPLCSSSQYQDLESRLTAANSSRSQLATRLKFNNENITEEDPQLNYVKASIASHLSQTSEGRAVSEAQIAQYAELVLISINPTGAPIVNSMETFYKIGEALAAMVYRDLTQFESRLPTLVVDLTPESFPDWLKTRLALASSTSDLVQLDDIKAARVVGDKTYAVGLIKKQLQPQEPLVVNTAVSIN